MATLYFKVSSDYEEVIRLRQECEKLEAQLLKMDKRKSLGAVASMETQLASTRQQMMGLVTEAAKAGAVMENDLKKKISSTTKVSEELSEEIIKQKKIIRETQEDVRRLSEQYSKMNKYSPKYGETVNELNRAKAALNEQRYSLGELQEQQAKNRLELRKLNREYKDFAQSSDKSTEIVDNLIGSLKRTAAEIGGFVAIKQFSSDVIDATGKMQQLQVALSTILQDKSKADALLADISKFAVTTPFSIDDVATGAKQLLAYGSSADTVVDELSMLGDVASGLQIPLGQLIYLYGTLRTQGRAYWRDIQQFQGRGINVIEELAKVLGVAQNEVQGLVTEGVIGFKEVEQAFKNMTSEGGKFNNMLANSAGTWPQQIAAVQETLFLKMNDFGNKYKEVFELGIGTAEDLVENLEDVISIIGSLVAAYGTYKAAVIAVAVAQKASGFVESIRLMAMFRKEMTLATAAQQAFNIAAKANVYVTLLSVLVGLATAVYMFSRRTDEATAVQKRLNDAVKEAEGASLSEQRELARLKGELLALTKGTDEYNAVKDKIVKGYGKYYDGLEDEIEKVGLTEQAYNKLTEAISKSFGARQYEKFKMDQQNELDSIVSDNLGKIQERLYEDLGDEKGSYVYTKIRQSLLEGKGLEKEVRDILNDVQDKGTIFADSRIDSSINRIRNAYKMADELDAKARDRFGIENFSMSDNKEKDDIKVQTTYQQDLAAAKDDWDKAKKGYEAIIKDQDATSKQVIEARNALKSAEDKYYDLLGTKPTKNKSDKTKESLFITVPDEEVQLISPEEIEKNIAMHREAMDQYLSEYGDYQQKRLAIADMYALKISQAETEGEKLSLQKQSEEALKTLDFEEFKKSINFADVFGDLDAQTTASLRALRDKLGDYINEAAKDLRPEDLKELQDAFKNLDFKIADRDPFHELKAGLEEYKSAQEAVNKAQEDLNTVLAGGTVTVNEYDKATGKLVKKTLDQTQAEKNLNKALSERQVVLANLTKAANSLGSHGVEVVNAGNEVVDMLQSLGVEIPDAISNTLEGVGQVMNGLASIDLTKPFSAITGTISVLTGVGKTIGGLFGLGGADYSGYEEMKSRYDNLISVWDTLISKKMEYIDIDYGVEAQKAADEAAKLVETQIQRQRQLANMLAGSGASIGSHSLGYRINDRMTQNDWTNLSDLVGQRVSGINDVLSLDADVIGKVLQDEKFVSVLTTVNSDFIEYIQNIEKYGEQLEEIAEKEKEVFTGISLDSFEDSFVDMLSDLDAKNEDFAENFEGYLQKAIFSSLVANQYKDRIKKLYDSWAKYGESGNQLTADEAQNLRNEYQDIVNDMLEQREQIMKDFGWDSSSSSSEQTASSRGFGTEMTHEDAGELSGRFTALQMTGEEIKIQNQQQTIAITELRGSITALTTQTQSMHDIADETRTILANSYMELQEIRENTGESAKYLKDIKADIAVVKQNTAKL